MSKDYVLGADQIELERLGLQHSLWSEQLVKLFQKVDIKPQSKILELGCGPGYTTDELLRYTNEQVQITALDQAENFLKYIDSKKHPRITTVQTNLNQFTLQTTDYDLAFCRWVMIFLSDIESTIKSVAKHLKPSSYFLMQEYISYGSFDLIPQTPYMQKVVDAIFKSWTDQGGHPNQGKYLPMTLEKNGFEVIEIEPIARTCRPNEPLWAWPDSFWKSFLPRLVETNYLKEEERIEFMKAWKDAESIPGAFCLAPMAVNIIARKK